MFKSSILGKDGEGEEEAGEPEVGAGSKVGNFKDGAYLLHVLIETGKNLELEGEDSVDPLIRVSLLGKSGETAAKEDIGPLT